LKTYVLLEGKQQMDRIEKLLEAQRNRPADPAAAEEVLRFAPEEDFEIAARRRREEVAHPEATPKRVFDPDYVPDWKDFEDEMRTGKK
jgi:hypothetical protein